MSNVVINFNFGSGKSHVAPEVRHRSLDIQPNRYSLEPEMVRYLIYEGMTGLDILQHRAVSSGKAKGKQCKKGQACGNSCISATKTCKAGLNGVQKEKAKTVKAKTATKSKPKAIAPKPPAPKSVEATKETPRQSNTISDKFLAQLEKDREAFYTKRLDNDFIDVAGLDVKSLQSEFDSKYDKFITASSKKKQASMELEVANLAEELKSAKRIKEDTDAFIAQGGSPDDKQGYRKFLEDKYDSDFERGRQMARGIPSELNERINGAKRYTKELTGDEKTRLDNYTKAAEEILGRETTGVFIAISSKNVEAVLADRFLNVNELQKEVSIRQSAENSKMGIPVGNPPPPYTRPVYGYIDSNTEVFRRGTSHSETKGYGDVRLELKREVMENNTTLTSADSFDLVAPAVKYGSDTSSAWVEKFDSGNPPPPPKTINELRGDKPYIEAQIYGGVDASKISTIHYPKGATPPDNVIEMAKKNGINIVIGGKSK